MLKYILIIIDRATSWGSERITPIATARNLPYPYLYQLNQLRPVPTPYLHDLDFGPEDLPPISPLDLRRAWRVAHLGAEVGLIMAPGDVQGVSFRTAKGLETKFMFVDMDAACWAASIDRSYDLRTARRVSLLFRLLALIEIMSQAEWLRPFFSLNSKDGATLHPNLLAAAATEPLSKSASFDVLRFKQAMNVFAQAPVLDCQTVQARQKKISGYKPRTKPKKAKR
ncbi:MAG: hypothetical protein EXR11_06935 [Rhodospirillaceae bacterium]|nr:hypothetical protein [Rhodospirillaceae bacterium]